MTRFYLDTEFIERGHEHPIELISVALVTEAGDALYIELVDGWDPAHASEWVCANVLPHLAMGRNVLVFGTWPHLLPRVAAAQRIREFVARHCGLSGKPEFWGYFADYDWVVFCQLFGAMIDLPKGWPMFCRDIIQLCKDLGNPLLPRQSGTEHHALADARHIRVMHQFLLDREIARRGESR